MSPSLVTATRGLATNSLVLGSRTPVAPHRSVPAGLILLQPIWSLPLRSSLYAITALSSASTVNS